MTKIEGFRVRNFKLLKDVTLGRLWNQRGNRPLKPMTAVIGRNGAGKSVLFDAFGFLADALKLGVEEACDARGRGGFEKLRTQGVTAPIEFEVHYRERANARPITYEIAIEADPLGRPQVRKERLRQRRRNQSHGRPFSFLWLNGGRGVAWKGEDGHCERKLEALLDEALGQEDIEARESKLMELEELAQREEPKETEAIELEDRRKPGIAILGALAQHPRISALRRLIEGWCLSYFTPDAAPSLLQAGPQSRLNVHGANLGNVVQFMECEHPRRFRGVLERIAEKIPGIDRIDTERTNDGRLLLRFNDRSFQDPFYAQQVSDGTLKVFAYLLLLEDPEPAPFLCIEEPENGLHHKLLETLANEFREHATGSKGSQVFVTTHQPYFVDALSPEEVWILEKGEDGFSEIRRASDDPTVNNMVEEGLPLGGLWYSEYLDAR